MEAYPTELTSPPVPLVALIGAGAPKELQLTIGEYLRTQNAPRIHSIAIPDAHSAAGTFGIRKAAPSSGTPAGILKAAWLRKHRTSRPAVAAVIADRESVAGDPSAWAWLVSQLDAIKSAVKARGTRVVVMVVQQPGGAEVPEDRIAMICRQAAVDRRCVLVFSPTEGLPALQVVGKLMHEQAAAFYTADAQRRLANHAHRNMPSVDLNLRMAFKLGALAEFRGDWAAAVRMYGEAYGYVPQVLANSAAQPQRFAEVRAVAEHVHVKVVSLLLLALKQLPDALAQFEAHIRLFRRMAFEAPPGLLASHHSWLCRQHQVMAELLISSGADLALLKREQQPGQLYLAAAKAAIERRKVAGFISGMHGGKAPAPPGRVEPGQYIGQLLLLPADPAAAAVAASGAAVAAALAGLPVSGATAAAGTAKRLTNDQFELFLEAVECHVEHGKATIALLRTAQAALRKSDRRSDKTLQHVLLLEGDELLEAGDTAAAQRLLTKVAGFYRRERWEAPLAATLLLLRECRQHEHDVQAHTELSLEVASLESSSLDREQRVAMATAAAAALAPSPPLLDLGEQQEDGQQQQGGMQYTVPAAALQAAAADSGWLTVLPLCAGFFDPAAAAPRGSTSGDGTGSSGSSSGSGSVRFAAAVWNNAPIDLPLAAAEVQLFDARGSFTAALLPETSSSSSSAGDSSSTHPAARLALPAGAWLRLTAAIPVRRSGQLQAAAVVLRFGDGSSDPASSSSSGGSSSVTFQLPPAAPSAAQQQQQPPAAAAVAGWLRGGWASSRLPFSTAAGFLAGQYGCEVPPQHSPPLLLLQAPEVLLQGEQAAVLVTVVAAADAVRGAVLLARAVHSDSQQQMGLVAVARQAAAAAAPEPSSPQQQQQGDGSGGDAGGSSSRSVLLGDLAAGQQRQVKLLLDARQRGGVEIGVELKYTAAAHGSTVDSGGKPEAGHSTASLAVQVLLPWKLGLQLLGPPATHTLLAAAPPAAGAAARGSSSSDRDADLMLLEQQQQQRVQSLSIQDSTASLPAGGGGADLAATDSRDMCVLLLRGLPSRYVLPAGQQCTAVVQLQSLAACLLDVLSVELESAAGTAAVAAELAPAGSATSAPAGTPPADTLNKSDMYTAAFSIASSSSTAAAELPSLGLLRLRWRRHQARPPLLAAAARGAAKLAAAEAKAAAAELLQVGAGAGAAGSNGSSGSSSIPAGATAAAAAPAWETLVPLPAVSFLLPLLTAAVRFPPTATAGCPSELQLLLHNSSGGSQDVAVAVGDPHGFLMAGPKTTSLQLLPHSSASVSWQAVPYHTGPLRLPEVTATSAQHAQQVEVTRGCTTFVERLQEQQEADQ